MQGGPATTLALASPVILSVFPCTILHWHEKPGCTPFLRRSVQINEGDARIVHGKSLEPKDALLWYQGKAANRVTKNFACTYADSICKWCSFPNHVASQSLADALQKQTITWKMIVPGSQGLQLTVSRHCTSNHTCTSWPQPLGRHQSNRVIHMHLSPCKELQHIVCPKNL